MASAACPADHPTSRDRLLRRIAIAGRLRIWCGCAERDSREPPDLGRSSESRRDGLPPQDHVAHHCSSHRSRWRADHPQGARCRARQPRRSRLDERAMARRTPRVASIVATIGFRMALGAQRHDVLRLVMRESMLLVIIGVAAGLATALFAGRFVATLLYGVPPTARSRSSS